MNFYKYFLIISVFCSLSAVKSTETIAYLDMQVVFSNSLVGKSLQLDLTKIKNKLIEDLEDKEKILKDRDAKILSQINILAKNDYENKVSLLKKDITEYKRIVFDNETLLKKKQSEANSLLMKHLTPIITEYSKKNSISMLIDKKNIIIAKSSLDITDSIIKLLDNKIKKIDLIK